ncbi:alcohol dehydrogenase [Pholiota conissans]|uniref:Alcohol dehydrogenase n=1 Tax=Pholiota conissans TaxID=109636 RepID=A0A9P5YPW3_9AGAR|nr:alcohol dehydrogenase [Pholiota conissans]
MSSKLHSFFCFGAHRCNSQGNGKPSLSSIQNTSNTYDYIIIGSGPGGGPLAARLAQANFSVLLIDAGDDHGNDTILQIPILGAQASECAPTQWEFFISHFDDPPTAKQNSKFTWEMPDGRYWVGGSTPMGLFYPRGAALGASAQVNTVVTIYPAESDWNYIASITGDDSWSAENMRQYWIKLENNQYLIPGASSGHGFGGWLDVSRTDLQLVLKDMKLISMIQGAGTALGQGLLGDLLSTDTGLAQVLTADLNSDAPGRDASTGLFQFQWQNHILSTANALNDGSRKFRLNMRLNTLVTRIILDDSSSPPRAVGVEYLTGKHLYRADPNSASTSPIGSGSFFASREVIISGGSAELTAHNIPVILDAPAVGTNMQDRYEISVIGKTDTDFAVLKGCTFLNTADDPCYLIWRDDGFDRGVYGTNGYAFAIVQQSSVAASNAAELFTEGIVVNFNGFFPGYSNRTSADARHWAWLILKAHSRNNADTVSRRSSDPRDTPKIDFRSFTVGGEEDLEALYEAVLLARKMFKEMIPLGGVFEEEVAGPEMQSEDDGHHTCCTVPICAVDDAKAILNSKFRVKGVQGLRVVDASVFSKIPSLYIAAAVYTISEKAAEAIIEDAQMI